MIPATAHFIWFGAAFPWVHLLALRSAALRGGFARVVLHHADDLRGAHWWPEAAMIPGFEARPIDPDATFRAAGVEVAALRQLWQDLEKPEARSNVLRAALLAAEGGVYLDMDTVTVASFDALRGACGVFYGLERIVWPAAVRRSRSPTVWAAALGRAAFREACRWQPDGWRTFRRHEGRFPLAPNNAVLGGEAGHPFLRGLLDRMAALAPGRRGVRFALGTHLLQDAADDCRDPTVRAVAPGLFYPLGPEISEHWFREDGRAGARELLAAETLTVHWYASVRTREVVPRIDPGWVRRRAPGPPFAELAADFL